MRRRHGTTQIDDPIVRPVNESSECLLLADCDDVRQGGRHCYGMDNATRHVGIARRFPISLLRQYGSAALTILRPMSSRRWRLR